MLRGERAAGKAGAGGKLGAWLQSWRAALAEASGISVVAQELAAQQQRCGWRR